MAHRLQEDETVLVDQQVGHVAVRVQQSSREVAVAVEHQAAQRRAPRVGVGLANGARDEMAGWTSGKGRERGRQEHSR